MPYRLLIPVLSLLVLLSACTTSPTQTASPAPARPDRGTVIAAPAQLEDALGELSTRQGEERTTLAMAWARSYLASDRPRDAEALLNRIDGERLSGDLRLEWLMLRAQLLLARQEAGEALALLSDNQRYQVEQLVREAPLALQNRYLLLRADALTINGELTASLRERVAVDPMLDTDSQRYNQQMIWTLLMQMPQTALQALADSSEQDLLGWAQLAQVYRDPLADIDRQIAGLQDWERRWRDHPAARNKPVMVQALQQAVSQRPRRVAVLLPEAGSLAGAAQAVRDGILAGYYSALAQGNPVPDILFFDTHEADLFALYNQALVSGAEFIIGPLDKEQVTQLAGVQDLPVTTLTLNYADAAPASANLYQFGLAPEDEARQIARQAYAEGARLAGVLYPENEWGQRLAAAFTQAWQEQGGILTAQRAYGDDISNDVKQMLSIEQSRARSEAVAQFIQEKVHLQDRRRQDLDFIFIVASPAQGRQLKPALNFHYAEDLPVYSTSHIYNGQPDRRADTDLNGIRFVDVPWLLDHDSALHQTVAEVWPQGHGRYERLFAMGVDAYRLQARLALLREVPGSSLPGATGELSLDAQHRLVRELDWAWFRRGQPERQPVVQAP
ncbi:lipoprotein [Alcanivorax sp. S71-1-4]|uniref:penicillin-binding protein activator n=1 Tax=Alcanivorax sp. S71-1-4 TaxID=1177159 RepID=UPI001358A2CD|nr:penicillin-binding protein activator [Alcanivorax sp. S71-1-4]KAF0808967.1 lipoprotein [Alcanivorax sp. S71-1-4]